jgi:hypothetical protein
MFYLVDTQKTLAVIRPLAPQGFCSVGADRIEIDGLSVAHAPDLEVARKEYGNTHVLIVRWPDTDVVKWRYPNVAVLYGIRDFIRSINSRYINRGVFELSGNAGRLAIYHRPILAKEEWDPRIGKRHHQVDSIEEYHRLRLGGK